MKNVYLVVVAGLALMACTPADEPATTASTETTDSAATTPAEPMPPAADPAPAPDTGDTCNMAQYASLVGKPATDPEVPPAGATVRHIRPDSQVTMDFLPTRLNLDISAEGVITGVRCG